MSRKLTQKAAESIHPQDANPRYDKDEQAGHRGQDENYYGLTRHNTILHI
jgi:hypothetical protein